MLNYIHNRKITMKRENRVIYKFIDKLRFIYEKYRLKKYFNSRKSLFTREFLNELLIYFENTDNNKFEKINVLSFRGSEMNSIVIMNLIPTGMELFVIKIYHYNNEIQINYDNITEIKKYSYGYYANSKAFREENIEVESKFKNIIKFIYKENEGIDL